MSYFQTTSSERRGVVILGIALLLVLIVALVGRWLWPGGSGETKDALRRSVASPRYFATEERKMETFDFDPNEADSTVLLRLGFAPFQVRGIYKYRAKGGRYHEPADVQRIPGMTNEMWERLGPHVRIAHRYRKVTPPVRTQDGEPRVDVYEQLTTQRDTVRYPVKLTAGEVVSLNEADTAALKKIPGIGSYYARQIVRYREQLGGYVSLAQLQEIEGMPEGVEQWLSLGEPAAIRRIDVNHASKNQLVRHPYLRVYRARDIWDYRHNVGPLQSIDDLSRLPNFTDDDIRRLEPYLEFK